MKWICTALLWMVIGGVPGECVGDDENGYFIMTIGGSNASETYIGDVELTSLDPMSFPVPDCLTNLSGLAITRAAGALDSFSGSPFVCGGRSNGDYTDLCYKYEEALDEWIILETMTERRGWGGYDSSELWGLVMAGGTSGVGFLSSVETTFDGEVFGSLPDLPNESQESCVVIINDFTIFTCGGYPTGSDTLIYTHSEGSWSSMSPMPAERWGHSCGLVQDPERGPEVIVTGGYSYPDYVDTVYIYNVDTDSWREANPLPLPIGYASAVKYNDTLLLIGGYTGNQPPYYLDDVYQYNAKDDDWLKLPSELRTPRNKHVSLLVPQSLFPECS